MYYYKRTIKKNRFLQYAAGVFIVFAVIFVYKSPFFERQAPKISVDKKLYWNLKDPIKIRLQDDSGIKSYSVNLIKEDGQIKLLEKNANGEKLLDINVYFPARTFFPKGKTKLSIEVSDESFWNFGTGNKSKILTDIVLDRQKPNIDIIAKSYAISLGGAAVVIYKAYDENLQSTKIVTNFGDEFKPVRFYKKDYYIALIARDLRTRGFKAYIHAVDKANNVAQKQIGFLNKNVKYQTSKIKLSNGFLNGKIVELYAENFKGAEQGALERFIKINEDLRKKAENTIVKNTRSVLEAKLTNLSLERFEPLKHYLKVGSFGDHRYFYFDNKPISESYHLGIDIANNQNGSVFASNPAKVVYADYNGVYGKMIALYHGLGLYTIYGHCDEINVKPGSVVKKDQIIATTGKTGLALGDHLHFELRVQGVPVRPIEWLDDNWIKFNIERPIKKAIEIIDGE